MLDYTKLGPANSPTPTTPQTTAPIAPASPGSLTQPVPAGGSFGSVPNLLASPQSQKYDKTNPDAATQGQVDAMMPWDKFGRGLDLLGAHLFGQNNGSALGGVPVVGNIGRELGRVGDAAAWTVVKPFEAGATALSHMPIGWVPGGADDTFNQIGDQLKTSNPALYAEWLLIRTHADADVLFGANEKADFNIEYLKMQDDMQKESFLGGTPELVMGRAGSGSVGGALSNAIKGFLGIGSNTLQGVAGNVGLLDPYYSGHHPGEGGSTNIERLLDIHDNPTKFVQNVGSSSYYQFNDFEKYAVENVTSGKWSPAQAQEWIDKNINTKLNRVEESAARLEAGLEVSDVEKDAVKAWQSGAWSQQHAADYIVSHGQGVTRNPVGQILGAAALDPLTYATLGAGAVSKMGVTTGTRLITMAGEGASMAEKLDLAATNMERLAVVVATVQKGEVSGPIFRITRGLVDPLAVYKPSSVARAVTDLKNGVAVESFMRTYGPATVKDVRALAREHGITTEIDSAMASYAMDKADEMVTIQAARDMLNEGLGEELVHTHPDEMASALSGFAGRDAVTELTDHMQRIMKNTFTAEEQVNLSGRMATIFGKDVAYWDKELANMSFDMRSALHAATYKRAEVAFEQARAAIDQAAYDGELSLKNMVLMSPETLDTDTAEAIVANIRGALENEAGSIEDPIATATAEWNTLTRRYGFLSNIGYATGGKEQLETLVKELEKEIERGRITKSLAESELSHPSLKPLRDFLDTHSVPGADRIVPPRELAARSRAATKLAEKVVADAGFTTPSVEKFYGAITKASKVVKSNGRRVGETVYRYPKSAYKDMRLFLSADGKTGFAIKADGDLVSVFNVGEKGVVQKIIPYMHDLGATKLDAFDEVGRLPELYGKGGFVETGRDAWNPQYAPAGWTGGTPDVVYMEHPGAPIGPVIENTPTRLWKIGFRPDEEVAWGLKRNADTGLYTIDRAPTISHNVDAVPFGRQKFSDTTRNVLGQIVGKSAAESATKPVESIEAFLTTLRDGVTGQRLVKNIDQRFERSTFDAGIPKPISAEIMKRAKEAAGLDYSNVRGIKPENLWKAINDVVPIDFVMKDGSTLNIHIVMDHLLQAAEGDFRIMGLTSALSQKARVALRHMPGPIQDGSNVSGQLTVGIYNKMRYAFNPMFIVQRITDAPYYSILYGTIPVGLGGKLSEANAALRAITENMGRTGIARHFSMDMPEFATRSNFTEGIRSGLQQAGVLGNKLQAIKDAPDAIIAANMTNMLHARMGDIVEGALENLKAAAKNADPEMQAEMLAAGERFRTSFDDIAMHYNELAGRTLTRDEVGVQYVQDMLSGWRRTRVNPDGTLNFTGMLRDGEWTVPASIGEVQGIHPDDIAQEVGARYENAAALRRDVTGHVEKVNGVFTLVKGEHDLPWLEEQLRTKMHLHPDVIKRTIAYFGDTWDGFWTHLAAPLEQGGLDITPHYAKEAQDLIATIAKDRGMDPWEYLSGVMATNIGPSDLNTAMGRLAAFLKRDPGSAAPGDWAAFFQSHLDPSAQSTLIAAHGEATGTALGNAVVPDGFTTNPNVIAGGTTSSLPRDGIFHVTTATDAVKAGGFKGSTAGEAVATAPAPGAPPIAPFTRGDTMLKTWDSVLENMGLPKRAPDGTLPGEVLPKVKTTVGKDGRWTFPDGYPPNAPHVLAESKGSFSNADELKLTAADGTPNEIATFTNEFGNRFGVPGSERPIQYVYRAISEEDYQGILKSGVIKSDGRMNLGADEGTVASHRDPSWYLPGDQASLPPGEYGGRVIKVKVREGDGWHLDGRDSYIKTSQPIPADRIEMSSPKITKTKTATPSKHNTPERTYADDIKVETTSIGDGPVKAEAAKVQPQGFGSKGDVMNDGRVSVLTNRARAQTYQDRLILAVRAARGEANQEEVLGHFRPLYEKAFGEKATEYMVNVVGAKLAANATTPEQVFQMTKLLDGGLIGSGLDPVERAVKITSSFEEVERIDPAQIGMLELASSNKGGIAKEGLDAGELTLLPEDLRILGTGTKDSSEFFDTGIIDMLKARVASGQPHPNADVEGILQHVSKLVQMTLKGSAAEGQTRTMLRDLVEAVPTTQAVPFNRTHALVVTLLKNKIQDAQQDVFRLAEMQTKRTVLERSLNHPLFGLYPSSYMWGKVLPETVKFLAKNPYAATYVINDVQRAIAIQREYDTDFDKKMNAADESSGAFLADYLTPSLPWSSHEARMSPLVRDILEGKDLGAMWKDELATISPQRWVSQVVNTVDEIPGAVQSLQNEQAQQPALQSLINLPAPAGGAPAGGAALSGVDSSISGPTPAAALAPILADDLARLKELFVTAK